MPEQRTRTHGKDGLTYVWIPKGTFLKEQLSDGRQSRSTERLVTVEKGFWITATPITIAAYRRFAADFDWPSWVVDPAIPDDHPVHSVSWIDAAVYCYWAGGRLPTDIEWEYAARGGINGTLYPWGNEISPANANYDADSEFAKASELYRRRRNDSTERTMLHAAHSRNETTPVMKYRPNGFGLYDVCGNVHEWVGIPVRKFDADDVALARRKRLRRPWMRYLRGGSCRSQAHELRLTSSVLTEDGRWPIAFSGFRCALDT